MFSTDINFIAIFSSASCLLKIMLYFTNLFFPNFNYFIFLLPLSIRLNFLLHNNLYVDCTKSPLEHSGVFFYCIAGLLNGTVVYRDLNARREDTKC